MEYCPKETGGSNPDDVGNDQNAPSNSRQRIMRNEEGIRDQKVAANINDALNKTSDEKITFPSNTELGHTTRLSPRQVTARVFINETRNIIRKGNSGLGSTTRFLPRQVLERSISKAAKDDDDEVGVLG